MRTIAFFLAGLITGTFVGCGSKPVAKDPSLDVLRTPSEDDTLKERASGLAKQIREAMTTPAILALEEGLTADTGLRGMRQREGAQPLMRKLLACGKPAEESLWQLLNDPVPGVRRSCILLLDPRNLSRDEGGNLFPSRIFMDLNIPLLEKALASKDEQVRYFACAGLGDFATFSEDCLEPITGSLPKIRELLKDNDPKIRVIAKVACQFILSERTRRAKNPQDREAAAEELKRLEMTNG